LAIFTAGRGGTSSEGKTKVVLKDGDGVRATLSGKGTDSGAVRNGAGFAFVFAFEGLGTKEDAAALSRRGDRSESRLVVLLLGEAVFTTMLAYERCARGVAGMDTERTERSESVRSMLEIVDVLRWRPRSESSESSDSW
jgi:hypothetical protein